MAGLHGCHRCLAPDLPGFGRSALPRGFDFSLPSLARWIAQLLQALGVEGKIHLVVHDLGGPYGLAWAVEHPRRVATAVVINSLFTSRLRWHAWARIWRTPILGELSMALMNRWLFGHELRRGSPDLSDAYLDRVYEHSTPALRRMVLKVYRASDPRIFRGWEEQWAALATTIPVKVLWGMKDPYLPPELAETFGSSDIERLPQVGHWLPAEAPALLVDRLTRFLGGESDAGQTLGQGSA
jgi:pimeloyl-ACP methyl ester carboxylesterase